VSHVKVVFAVFVLKGWSHKGEWFVKRAGLSNLAISSEYSPPLRSYPNSALSYSNNFYFLSLRLENGRRCGQFEA
jgi:hypothetical protein